MTEPAENTDYKPTKYESNKRHIIKYYKKRYENDDDFKQKEITRINNIHKQKYLEDPEYKKKCNDYVKNYRIKQRQQKIEEKQKIIEELKQKQEEEEKQLFKLQKFLKS